MKISVLICTRNQAALLQQTLDAIFGQKCGVNSDYEVIVVDNASTDMTRLLVAEYISSLPNLHYGRLRYCHEAHISFSAARNSAMRVAQGDIFVFVQAGNCPGTNWLDEICAEFASAPSLQLLIGGLASHDAEIVETPISKKQWQSLTSLDEIAPNIGGSLALRRNVLKIVGGFDSELGGSTASILIEEIDFVYRALKAGSEILSASTLIASQTGPLQAANLRRINCKSALAFVRKHLLLGDLFAVKVALGALLQSRKRSKELPPQLPAIEWQTRVH